MNSNKRANNNPMSKAKVQTQTRTPNPTNPSVEEPLNEVNTQSRNTKPHNNRARPKNNPIITDSCLPLTRTPSSDPLTQTLLHVEQTTAEQAYNMRKRIQKEALKNCLHKKQGNSHKPESPQTELVPLPQQEKPMTKNEQKDYEMSLYTYWLVPQVATDGVYPAYEIPRTTNLTTVRPSYDFTSHEYHHTIQVAISGSGWYGVSSDETKNVNPFTVLPCTNRLTIPAYLRRRPITFEVYSEPSKNYMVVNPIYVKLAKSFPTLTRDQSLEKAVYSTAAKYEWSAVEGVYASQGLLLKSTADYFLDLITYKSVQLTSQDHITKTSGSGGPIQSVGDFGVLTTILSHVGYVDHHMPVDQPDVTLEPEYLDYPIRKDISIRSFPKGSAGRFIDTKFTVDGEDLVTPSSLFLFDDIKKPPTHSTVYNKLTSKDLLVYSNSNSNSLVGLARIIASKPQTNDNTIDSHLRRDNAVTLSYSIRTSSTHTKESNQARRLMLGNRVASYDFTPLPSCINDQGLTTRELTSKVADFVGHGVDRIIESCNPGALMSFMDEFKNVTSWAYHEVWLGSLHLLYPLLSREACARIDHVKKKLRERYVLGEKLHCYDSLMVTRLKASVKREIAKAGKRPRLFVDYGAGCMYANHIAEYVKVSINGSHTFFLGKLTCTIHILAKPKSASLDEEFTSLHDAYHMDNHVRFLIFSDDSVAVGRINGKSFMCNVDIATNDANQDMTTFLTAFECMANFSVEAAMGLIEQCTLPLIIPNACGEGYNEVKLNILEGSGTTITTLLNHLGDYINCLSTFAMLAYGVPLDVAFQCGAAMNGHEVTVDWCTKFEEVQFLKRYPVNIGGHDYVGAMGMGAVLRRFGVVDRAIDHVKLNLPLSVFNSMSHDQRFDLYQSSIIRGWKHEPSNPILDALRARYSATCSEVKHDSNIHIFVEERDNSQYDGTAAMMSRYGLEEHEVVEIVNAIANMRVGQWYDLTGVNKILALDYGM